MLYERWQEIAREFRNEVALTDLSGGNEWTFGELAAVRETRELENEDVIFPQGISAEFVFSVLGAWRSGKIVCPLEVGQNRPAFNWSTLPSKCVHLKVTSATTGDARLIAFKPEQLVADAKNIVATMGLRRDWPNLGVISLAHSYGFSNLVLPLLLHGIPLVLAPAPLPETVSDALRRMKAATLAAVPALWRIWYEARVIPANVRLAISAGAPLPLPLEQEVFKECGLKIHNFYGASECGGIAYDGNEMPRADAGCVGAPMKNVNLSVGQNDCLEVRGGAVGETYWPEEGECLRDGVFRASDFVEIKEGVVYLRGRAGDQINVAGRKISPETIERLLLSHSMVADCLVFGAPSNEAERTEQIVACIISRDGSGVEPLKQFLLARIPAWQVPREWWFVDSLEANQRGKLSRAEWRRKFMERQRAS